MCGFTFLNLQACFFGSFILLKSASFGMSVFELNSAKITRVSGCSKCKTGLS